MPIRGLGTPNLPRFFRGRSHACNYRNISIPYRIKSSPRPGAEEERGRNWSGCYGRSGLPTKAKFACPSEREFHCPLFTLKSASRSSIIRHHYQQHYIILVYRERRPLLVPREISRRPNGSRPRTYMPPAPRMGGHEGGRAGQGRAGRSIGCLCVSFPFVTCGDEAQGVREWRQRIRVGPLAHCLHTTLRGLVPGCEC